MRASPVEPSRLMAARPTRMAQPTTIRATGTERSEVAPGTIPEGGGGGTVADARTTSPDGVSQ
eukprot:3461347-Prymnesium_polylepis.1